MTARSRRPAIVLLLLFAVPLAVAFVLIYSGVWRPAGSTEHGDLIHPARPLPSISLTDAGGTRAPADFLEGSWTLVYLGDGACDERCRHALADMQRARELLGKDISRVQSAFLFTGEFDVSLRAQYPKLIAAKVDAPEAAQLIAQFPIYDNVSALDGGRIYIVDPHANLMMSYPRDATGIGMYEDLKKLLNLSHIG